MQLPEVMQKVGTVAFVDDAGHVKVFEKYADKEGNCVEYRRVAITATRRVNRSKEPEVGLWKILKFICHFAGSVFANWLGGLI